MSQVRFLFLKVEEVEQYIVLYFLFIFIFFRIYIFVNICSGSFFTAV